MAAPTQCCLATVKAGTADIRIEAPARVAPKQAMLAEKGVFSSARTLGRTALFDFPGASARLCDPHARSVWRGFDGVSVRLLAHDARAYTLAQHKSGAIAEHSRLLYAREPLARVGVERSRMLPCRVRRVFARARQPCVSVCGAATQLVKNRLFSGTKKLRARRWSFLRSSAYSSSSSSSSSPLSPLLAFTRPR